MSRNEKRKSTRNVGSQNGHWVVRGSIKVDRTLKSRERFINRQAKPSIYIGPSVEGTDKQYVKVISGVVDDKKPSFA